MREVTIETVPVNKSLLPFPEVVIFEIVAGCNLRCIMCPEKDMTRPWGLMDLGLYKRLVDEISRTNPDTEVWAPIMGEVFVHKDRVFDYIDYAKSAGLRNINLNTNLLLFKEGMLGRLGSSGLKRLTVGVDAVTSATYGKIRVNGNFRRLEKNIRLLLDAKALGRLPGLEIVLQFIVQKENEHEEGLFRKKWIDSGATLKIRHRLGWGNAVEAAALTIPNSERNVPCPWLMRTMSIHSSGMVAQCDADWNGINYLGDLNRQGIQEVWLDRLLSLRKRHLDNDFAFSPCSTCRDWQCGLSETIRAQ
jgi:pyruvate-formate lyase-activating enzyme